MDDITRIFITCVVVLIVLSVLFIIAALFDSYKSLSNQSDGGWDGTDGY